MQNSLTNYVDILVPVVSVRELAAQSRMTGRP